MEEKGGRVATTIGQGWLRDNSNQDKGGPADTSFLHWRWPHDTFFLKFLIFYK